MAVLGLRVAPVEAVVGEGLLGLAGVVSSDHALELVERELGGRLSRVTMSVTFQRARFS